MEYTGIELLRIVNWNKHFENSRSRQRKQCYYCCLPSKTEGDGYIQLTESEHPAEVYTAWVSMALIVSRQYIDTDKDEARDGTLITSTGVPHTAATLAIKSRFPEKIFKHAIPILITIGWLEVIDGTKAPVDPKKKKKKKAPPKKNLPVFEDFIVIFNKICETKYKGDQKAEGHFNARVNSGYTLAQMATAIDACHADDFHASKNYKYLTPEYVLRDNQIDKWLNVKADPTSAFEGEGE